MNIHAVKRGKNHWCGPSAISAVTRLNTDGAAKLIKKARGHNGPVKGTSTWEIAYALKEKSIRMTRLSQPSRETMAQWLKRTVKERKPGRVFLLAAGNHWQLVSGRRYVCGLSGEVVSVKHKACRKRARVTAVFELTKRN